DIDASGASGASGATGATGANPRAGEPQDAVVDGQFNPGAARPLPLVSTQQAGATDTVDLAIAAWLHAKFQRSRSLKTQGTYSAILQAYRSQLLARGLDLDAADPRRVAADFDADSAALADQRAAESAERSAERTAERTRALALA